MTIPKGTHIQAGDTVLFIGKDRRTFVRTMLAGQKLQTHYGVLDFDGIIGTPYGEQVRTHSGSGVYVLPPSIDDIVRHIHRETQVIYPKDLGYIALKMNIVPGATVLEAGTGSGALTTLMAILVGDEGHVYSYERRAVMQQLARKNINKLGLQHRVTFIERDIHEGFEQQNVDALFLDVPNPWEFLPQARAALKGGGFFGSLLPTVNQMLQLLETLYKGQWYLLQAEELLLRSWRTIPARVRPDEEMNGHTGFLIFARAVMREIREEAIVQEEEE